MDRTIEVKVNGSYITKDNRNAGVQHEANSTSLRIEFDPSWDSYAKKITWWDAKGENPVEITLGTNLLEDAASSTRIYLSPIPGEPLAECGECTFVIDGYVDGKRQRSAADRLLVKEAPFKETAGQPSDPTPSQAEQLQNEIDGIKGTISQAVASRDAAAESAAQAKASETEAASSAGAAAKSEAAAAGSAASAAEDASAAAKIAGAAAQSEQNAKASETAAQASETTASSAAETAAQAKTAAESAKDKADNAKAAAESAKEAAEAARGKAESAQTAAEAAKTAAESSEIKAAASEKTAQSWAVGGTGTRVGEDTNNAKYWSERASAIVGGDFATKAEAQGYVATHNQSSAAHADLRQAIESKENAGAAAAVQQKLDTHTWNTTIHITAAERTKWNAKEEGGAASAVQQNLTDHIGDTVKHVTAAERTEWNGKADLVNGKVPSSQLPAADAFTKAETLKSATAALYGLGTGAVPDDVLAFLGKYNQHWWRRRTVRFNEIVDGDELLTYDVGSAFSAGNNISIEYSNTAEITGKGIIAMTNVSTMQASYNTYTAFEALRGKFAKAKAQNADTRILIKIPNDANVTRYTIKGVYYVAIEGNIPKIKTHEPGPWEYLCSSNRNAYPDSGTQDGYEYEYLGIPFDNAVTAPKIETGSYVGTGTYGQANPNTLTFGFIPKLVIIKPNSTTSKNHFEVIQGQTKTFSYQDNTNYGKVEISWDGNSISWYCTSDDGTEGQLNKTEYTYYYFAIG